MGGLGVTSPNSAMLLFCTIFFLDRHATTCGIVEMEVMKLMNNVVSIITVFHVEKFSSFVIAPPLRSLQQSCLRARQQ